MASLRSEVAGIFPILQKVEARYNRHAQLMLFTDCLVLLRILSIWGHSDFWPDPGDLVHFDVIFPFKLQSEKSCWLFSRVCRWVAGRRSGSNIHNVSLLGVATLYCAGSCCLLGGSLESVVRGDFASRCQFAVEFVGVIARVGCFCLGLR